MTAAIATPCVLVRVRGSELPVDLVRMVAPGLAVTRAVTGVAEDRALMAKDRYALTHVPSGQSVCKSARYLCRDCVDVATDVAVEKLPDWTVPDVTAGSAAVAWHLAGTRGAACCLAPATI